MKKVLVWTGVGLGAAVGTYYAIRGLRGARTQVKEGLGRAERAAGAARSVLESTERALHTTGESI